MKFISALLFIFFTRVASSEDLELLLREDFREIGPKLPLSDEHLVNHEVIRFETVGADEKTRLKLSHHPHIGDPHYLYFGPARARTAGLFHLSVALDLSHPQSCWRFSTRNTGGSLSYLMVKSHGHWWISQKSPSGQASGLADPFEVTQYFFHKLSFEPFDVESCETIVRKAPRLDWSAISGVGLFSPHRGGSTVGGKPRSTVRVDWFEVHGKPQQLPYLTSLPEQSGFFEEATPFFGSGWQVKEGNSSNRGVVLRLSGDHWMGFDTEQMRPAAVWRNPRAPLSLDTMASKSYPDVRAKASKPPQVQGLVLVETLPVWGVRDVAGKWIPIYEGLDRRASGPVLKYRLGEIHLEEAWKYQEQSSSLSRLFRLSPTTSQIDILLDQRLLGEEGVFLEGAFRQIHVRGLDEGQYTLDSAAEKGTWLRLAPSAKTLEFQISFTDGEAVPDVFTISEAGELGGDPYPGREYLFSEDVPKSQSGYELRTVQAPQRMAFDRAIRPMDLDFDSKGTAYICTIDGDVWKVTGIDTQNSIWKRFAMGLYEPTNIEINEQDEIFVLGRDQITRLVDRNADDCVDEYVCTNNRFNQTLHSRNFSLSMEQLPNGNFAVAKGGIIKFGDTGHHDMKHRGALLEVPRKQQEVSVIADGLRMPFVGVDQQGEIFASDQQGHYVPSTPVHHIARGHSYGFEKANLNQKKVSSPLVWYPYLENRSGAGFVSLKGERFQTFQDLLLQISWNGNLFGVVPDREQPFSWKLPFDLNFPCLNGEVHPINGKLYLAGIANTGYRSTTQYQLGLGEISPPATPLIPSQLRIEKEALSISFSQPIVGNSLAKVSAKAWNVKRTPKYGSGHTSWSGEAGEDEITVKEFTWAEDKKAIFIKTSPLYRCSILRLQLNWVEGAPLVLYARVDSLDSPPQKKFEKPKARKLRPANAKRGARVFNEKACMGCHSLEGASLTGPALDGIGERRTEKELRESILQPNAVIVEGYTAAMPSFSGILSEQELADVVKFLSELKE